MSTKNTPLVDVEEWKPPQLPPLPDTTGWDTDQLNALALERCQARGHKQVRDTANGGKPMADKRCRLEVLHGRDPFAGEGPIDVAELLKLIPPPDKGFSDLHRRLLDIMADRYPRDLDELAALAGTSTTSENVSARARDLRKMGYPIARQIIDGKARYWLGA